MNQSKTQSVGLVIIFNHNYPDNLPILKRIYSDRFSIIKCIIPFYRGNDPDVITVYDSSFYFQGYVAQAWKILETLSCDTFLFIADDLLLNPIINEYNCSHVFALKPHGSWVSALWELHPFNHYWRRCKEAVEYKPEARGAEFKDSLPSFEDALQLMAAHGLQPTAAPLRAVTYTPPKSSNADIATVVSSPKLSLLDRYYPPAILRGLWVTIKHCVTMLFGQRKATMGHLEQKWNSAMPDRLATNPSLINETRALHYPLVGSYSDIFVVSRDTMPTFAHYCGVFSVSRLHVELAIPTALALATTCISTESDTTLKGKALWTPECKSILAPYNNSLSQLLGDFPQDFIYLHPIKLSQWT
jgi:hypothetical protein